MSRYGDNIRRIAQTDELTKRVLQAEQRLGIYDKSSIPGARGIAYPSGAAQTGSPGVTNPDKNGEPDPKNPTDKDKTDEAGKDDKTTNGDHILNGTKKMYKGEDIGKIGLKDCETGEKIDVIMNAGGNDGETKFQHPNGWDIYGNPGNQEGYGHWELGYYWRGNSAFFPGTLTEAPTIEVGYKAGIGYHNPSFNYTVTDARIVNVVYNIPVAQANVEYYVTWASNPSNDGWVLNQQAWQRFSCEGESGTARCIAQIPLAYGYWQDQDPSYRHQLAFSNQDGGFVSSKYDEGLPAKFRNDAGEGRGLNNLKLCTDEGNEVVVSALKDGTFAFFEEDGFGFPEEDAKIFHFDSAGKYLDTIRPDAYDNLRTTNNPAAGG